MPSKYLAVARLSFQERIAYRGETLVALLASFARFGLAAVLWGAVYAGRAEVGGLSLAEMTAYYLAATLLSSVDQSEGYAWEFAEEIRSGCFAKYLSRPVSPLGWFLAVSAGRSLARAALALAAALALSLALPGAFAAPSPAGVAACLPVLALGLSALAALNFMTSILAFRFQDIAAFHMVKTTLVSLLSGAIVPLAIMPAALRGALSLTPFPALAGLPAELWLGRGLGQAPLAVAILLAWNAILFGLALAAFRSLSARYEEAGS